ncbi:MAG: type 1 glutamine amidotransferase domain-containing protein [Neisseriaceae bacterium]|nr:type 1 glutamine amidotransferase domain-containing protein [Neisseriaceae bacterium]
MTIQAKKALMIVTSHAQLGDTGRATGFYFEELAVPYWALRSAGLTVDIASIQGGTAPVDPNSVPETGQHEAVQRFLADSACMSQIQQTLALEDVDMAAYRLVFLPGGHGAMWDFPESMALANLISEAAARGWVIGAVCHGVAGLLDAIRLDGSPLLAGRRVNSFTNEEEVGIGLQDVVPFLLESQIRSLGGQFEQGPNFEAYVVRDELLVTGQNPASSAAVAESLLAALRQQEIE